jgi:hypothetical protein
MIKSIRIWVFISIMILITNNSFSQATDSNSSIPMIEYELDSTDYDFSNIISPIIVHVQFTVDTSEEFKNVKAKKITCSDCDKETKKHFKKLAVDIVSSSPKWEKDENSETKPKAMTFLMPIKFMLND